MYRAIIALTTITMVHSSPDNNESENSKFKVIVPTKLANYALEQGSDGFRHSQALFGNPSYGEKKIVGELVYVTPGSGETGCDIHSEELPTNLPERPIFLVDRGECDFVQKMRLAQELGAVAVIIADNVCQCRNMDHFKVDESKGLTLALQDKCNSLGRKAQSEGRILPGDTCERGLPFMADDGSGFDVHIPSFLVDFTHAQALKDCWLSASSNVATLMRGSTFKCDAGTKIIVSLEWNLPASDNNVAFDLWSSSDSEGQFKKAFKETAGRLGDVITFSPHYFIWDGRAWGCDSEGEPCATQCTKGGLYCNPDPDKDLFSGVSGKDVVDENLRELCVFEQAKATDANVGMLWWQYVTLFAETCHKGATPTTKDFNPACSKRVHEMIPGLSWDKTQKCVTSSWKSSTQNTKLDNELSLRANKKILTLPTAVVNGILLRGSVTPLSITSSICAGLKKEKQPTFCACVDHSTSTNLLDCTNSKCKTGEQLCVRDQMCYTTASYQDACFPSTKTTCASNQNFCKSVDSCLLNTEECPTCPDPTNPSWCGLTGKCVSSPLTCTLPVTPITQVSNGGISVLSGIMIALAVAAVCATFLFFYLRRQQTQIQEDVRAILSSYMPLEETDERLTTTIRSNGGGGGSGSGSGSKSRPSNSQARSGDGHSSARVAAATAEELEPMSTGNNGNSNAAALV